MSVERYDQKMFLTPKSRRCCLVLVCIRHLPETQRIDTLRVVPVVVQPRHDVRDPAKFSVDSQRYLMLGVLADTYLVPTRLVDLMGFLLPLSDIVVGTPRTFRYFVSA